MAQGNQRRNEPQRAKYQIYTCLGQPTNHPAEPEPTTYPDRFNRDQALKNGIQYLSDEIFGAIGCTEGFILVVGTEIYGWRN
jgi:hypothetical protein